VSQPADPLRSDGEAGDGLPPEDVLEAPAQPVMDRAPDRGESTGDPRVDAAVARLAELDERPTAEHVEVYDDVHRRLQDALSRLDGS
jgi:hypothetical protein